MSLDAGIKVNVVPGKAFAAVEGVSREILEQTAREAEKETGITFSFSREGALTKITAQGDNAHAAHPEGGNNALTGLLVYITRLPLEDCPQTECLKGLLKLIPHGDLCGKAMGIAMEDHISGNLTLAFSMLKVTEDSLDGRFDSRRLYLRHRGECAPGGEGAHGRDRPHPSQRHHEAAPPCRRRQPVCPHAFKRVRGVHGKRGRMSLHRRGNLCPRAEERSRLGAAMPGTDNRMHGADEFAALEDLLVSAKIFAQVIVDLCA